MAKVPLLELAHARSGDKGDTVNVGLMAYDSDDYLILVQQVTTDKIKHHFGPLVKGRVERFELPNLHALNFLLHGALDGGGTVSLMTDAQGKVFSTAMLRMEIDVPQEVAERVRGRGRWPGPRDADAGRNEGCAGAQEGGSAGRARRVPEQGERNEGRAGAGDGGSPGPMSGDAGEGGAAQ